MSQSLVDLPIAQTFNLTFSRTSALPFSQIFAEHLFSNPRPPIQFIASFEDQVQAISVSIRTGITVERVGHVSFEALLTDPYTDRTRHAFVTLTDVSGDGEGRLRTDRPVAYSGRTQL